jgi:hypothetical protein
MTIAPRRITKRFPWLLPFIGLHFLVGGAATWFLVPPPKLAARTQLHISVEPPNPLFPESRRVDPEKFRRNQAFLIRDRFVVSAALREPVLADLATIKEQTYPLQWLEKEIKVEFPSPEFMHSTLSGDRPDEIQQIVSAVTKSYLENVVDVEGKSRRDELAKVQKSDVPALVQLANGDKMADGKPKAVLSTTNETTRKWMPRESMTLVGLGILLLILAAFQYRA